MKNALERPQVNFRPTPVLKMRLQRSADQRGMPLNAEIIRRLEQSFVDDKLDALVEKTADTVASKIETKLKDQLMSFINAASVANELYENRKRNERQKKEGK